MDQVQHYLNLALSFLREGFNNVNGVEGLVIALVAAIVVPAWDRLWAVALGATVVHLVADVLIPVVANKRSFHLPPLVELSYWRTALSLYVGYFVAVGALLFIKRMFLSQTVKAH